MKLDSSIKRNTGFIKKLRKGFTKENKPSLIKDLGEVSFQKYLSEIVSTTNEALTNVQSKNEEVETAVEVVSGLHQRFNVAFTEPLSLAFLQNFNFKNIDPTITKDEMAFSAKLKNNLRVFTELYLVNVFANLDEMTDKELPSFLMKKGQKKEPILLSILKEALNYNFKTGHSSIVAIYFAKKFPEFFSTDDQSTQSVPLNKDIKESVVSIYRLFFGALSTNASKLQTQVNKLIKEHHKCQIRTGKASDEYLEKYEEISLIFERFKSSTLFLSQYLDVEAPQFEIIDINGSQHEQKEDIITNKILPPSQRLWENDETRKLYEVLPDISDIVKEHSQSNKDPKPETLNSFFTELQNIESKGHLDDLVRKYWSLNLNNKATRNRIIKFFIETVDWSKISLYARFFAINAPYMKETVDEFIQYLDNGFRSQLHNTKFNIKNVIFFGEMVKFSLIPQFMVFHKIRTLIINMNITNNVEILTILFENCGKFLLNKAEYKDEMDKLVDRLKSRRTDHSLNMNTKASIEMLLRILFPPSTKSLNTEVVQLTPEENFYTVLLRSELGNIGFKDTVRLIRKAHWKDPNTEKLFFTLFTEPEKVSYQNIPILTQVLSGLYSFNRNFAIMCIDQVLENIENGLESNTYAENTSRIANIRYLVEIFNYEMMKSNVLMDTMYHIVKYGHPNGQPNPFKLNPNDLPNNYFRIHLIVTILSNIRRTPSSLTSSLQLLLRFFEYYIFTKEFPLPKETEYAVNNLFEKLSTLIEKKDKTKFTRSANLLESLQKFQEYLVLTKRSTTENQKGTDTSTLKTDLLEDGPAQDLDDDIGQENDEGLEMIEEFEIIEDDGESYEENNLDTEVNTGSISSDESGTDLESDSELESADEDDSDDSMDSDSDSESDSDSGSEDEEDEFDAVLDGEDTPFRNYEDERESEQQRIFDEYKKQLQTEEEIKAQAELDKQFDLMMSESLEARKSETSTNDRGLLMVHPSGTKLKDSLNEFNTPEKRPKEKVAFAFLTKTGRKTQSRVVNLSRDIKFVSNVVEEGKKLETEREKIKNIVLNRQFD